jgi:hypothetical protein
LVLPCSFLLSVAEFSHEYFREHLQAGSSLSVE